MSVPVCSAWGRPTLEVRRVAVDSREPVSSRVPVLSAGGGAAPGDVPGDVPDSGAGFRRVFVLDKDTPGRATPEARRERERVATLAHFSCFARSCPPRHVSTTARRDVP
ncbi:hypothetical protein MFU01_42420 [Myxococcus fulvus]|uniref:Uncharacterized protein n=1 Tax=Myxococcus fulvus TaxID=33 RepID=A0A511T4X6_MYXFU|nr:hypothetical protein MFU01_42420 [Myxococcus fulvus]